MPGVYAVGDLVATPALAHVGFAEAIVAIRTILGEDVAAVDYDRVPWGIYCHPEVAFSGLTEQAAIDRGYDVVTSIQRFGGNGRALIVGEPDGMVKIVAERDGPILGVHIAGPWATELIAEGYLAVNWEATADDREARTHLDGVALGHDDLGQHTGDRRRHLGVDLVGGHLEQRLVDRDLVADALQPLRDRALGDRLAQLGHRHVHVPSSVGISSTSGR